MTGSKTRPAKVPWCMSYGLPESPFSGRADIQLEVMPGKVAGVHVEDKEDGGSPDGSQQGESFAGG